MRQIRVLDLGAVDSVRSQSIYHAVARALDAEFAGHDHSRDGGGALCLHRLPPGSHSEVDVEYCSERRAPHRAARGWWRCCVPRQESDVLPMDLPQRQPAQ